MKKNICIAYFLCVFGGIFGLHHFYLGRDRQAFVWWCLLGGFSLGWLRDFLMIPSYVADANDDDEFIESLTANMRQYPKPPWFPFRGLGQIVVANVWGYVFMAAIPEEKVFGVSLKFLIVLVPLACALGVHTVGNIGREEGSLFWALVGAYIVFPFYFFETRVVGWSSIISVTFFRTKSLKWRRTPKEPKHVCRRALTLSLCAMIWMSVWFSCFYFNMEVTDKYGTRVKLRDAVGNFLQSPVFQDFKKSMHEIWAHGSKHGWSNIWYQLFDRLDPLGEQMALKTLNLSRGASQEEIKTNWRHLSLRYHPDKYTSELEKQEAQKKFLEIQSAYEKLSQIKTRRMNQNTRTRQQ